ncbi:conserved exported hypothetical protein [Flavobacterium sp. 9AF]|uniref:hypothetical protein n=1 Tax=Flavobacterium sp. 9AF TaxID=2653142 RepID=UPI0012F1A5DC|nr:hypothetical protein [Flavobacterium sp. 9AF]VXB72204.1 conserved exported hypothetical protein [Flavobacterium sp. 9AF]
MKSKLLLLLVFFYFSCNQKNATSVEEDKEEFEMYEFSEMAGLMEQFYAENNKLKQQIIKGDTIAEFPEYFLNIHTAVLTEASDRDDFFNEQARKFIEAEKLIFEDSLERKDHFNAAVDACIACHQQKCLGPIPKIKKLYIK